MFDKLPITALLLLRRPLARPFLCFTLNRLTSQIIRPINSAAFACERKHRREERRPRIVRFPRRRWNRRGPNRDAADMGKHSARATGKCRAFRQATAVAIRGRIDFAGRIALKLSLRVALPMDAVIANRSTYRITSHNLRNSA